MGRLIDADKFEAFVIRTNGDEEFVNGVQYVLEKIDNAPTVDAITMEQISKYVIEINKILEEEKDDTRWCAGLRYSLRVLDKYCGKEQRDDTK